TKLKKIIDFLSFLFGVELLNENAEFWQAYERLHTLLMVKENITLITEQQISLEWGMRTRLFCITLLLGRLCILQILYKNLYNATTTCQHLFYCHILLPNMLSVFTIVQFIVD
ncbi:hypothetical protein ACJX0J_037241, partial [Zea mays]